MADDTRLSCGRSIDDVWEHVGSPPDAHERGCPYCQEARARLQRLSTATADLRAAEAVDPELQPGPDFAASVMSLVRAEVRRGQTFPLEAEEVPGLTISEQAVVGLVWTAADGVPGMRARRCLVRQVEPDEQGEPGDDGEVLSPIDVDVDLTVVVELGTSIPAASAELRRRVVGLVDAETGLRVRRVDLTVEDAL
ncbi:MAG TPA: Asp23/Gls24 family envelope stress response protein [Friedmanniella sp.]